MNRNKLKLILILLSFFFFQYSNAQTVTTLAGNTLGFANGTGTAAQFNYPYGVDVDAAGNIYVADKLNHRIRKISDSGVVTTFAGSTIGSADGTGTAAQFNSPSGVAVAIDGTVYVADTGNNRIRKITAAGVVTTLAGSTPGTANGTVTTARFNSPSGIAIDAVGNVYIADEGNHRIRKITSAGVVTTLAGSTLGYADGTGTAAQFHSPSGVAVDVTGNVYVADAINHRIRKISIDGVVITFAGSTQGVSNGIGIAAQFYSPAAVALDAAGNVYVADALNDRIRKITATGVVSTLAGSTAGAVDGTGTGAKFFYPNGVAVNAAGTVFVGDSNNHRIRKIAGTLVTNNYQLENEISIYPNPATTEISISNNNLKGISSVVLTDTNGRTVKQNTFDNSSSVQVNISDLSNGVYLMKITYDNKTTIKKIIKKIIKN
jgi:sugar lactone lactonase YvrE